MDRSKHEGVAPGEFEGKLNIFGRKGFYTNNDFVLCFHNSSLTRFDIQFDLRMASKVVGQRVPRFIFNPRTYDAVLHLLHTKVNFETFVDPQLNKS